MRLTILLAFACASVHVAHGEPKHDSAMKLFEEGRELAKLGKYPEACDAFARSYELEAAAGTEVNFADCQEHVGHLARAWQLFVAAGAESDRTGNGVRARYAHDRAASLVPRLATVSVHLADTRWDQLSITIGDRSVVAAPQLHEYADPGEIEVVVAARGKRFTRTLHAAAGSKVSLDVPALLVGGVAGERKRGWVLGAGVAGVAGLASISMSALLTISASRSYAEAFSQGECSHTPRGDECTDAGLTIVHDARSRANVATAAFIAGVALVGGSVALYVFAPREHALEVMPTGDRSSVGVTISGRF